MKKVYLLILLLGLFSISLLLFSKDFASASSCNHNGICEIQEDNISCPSDCGCDYDGLCEASRGENILNCLDCGITTGYNLCGVLDKKIRYDFDNNGDSVTQATPGLCPNSIVPSFFYYSTFDHTRYRDCFSIIQTGTSEFCTLKESYCGDGIIGTGIGYINQEQCDDGNKINGDGCNNSCIIDSNYCSGLLTINGVNPIISFIPSQNGGSFVLRPGNYDLQCNATIYVPNPINIYIRSPTSWAQLPNPSSYVFNLGSYTAFCDFTGCLFDITVATGCNQEILCGNGIVEQGEQCDDGNTNHFDGCNNYCYINDIKSYCSTDSDCNDNLFCSTDICSDNKKCQHYPACPTCVTCDEEKAKAQGRVECGN